MKTTLKFQPFEYTRRILHELSLWVIATDDLEFPPKINYGEGIAEKQSITFLSNGPYFIV